MEKTYNFTKNESRNLYIYLISIVVLTIGNGIYTFSISYYLLNETGSALYFSINLAISSITFLIVTPFAGVITDFFDRKKIVLSGEFLITLLTFILLLVVYFHGISLTAIFVTTFFRSLILPLVNNSFSASMSNLFNVDNLQRVFGLNGSIQSSAAFFGPILGGLIFGIFSLEVTLLLFVVASFVSFMLDFWLKFDLFQQQKPKDILELKNKNVLKNFFIEIRKGFKYLLSIPILRIVIFAGIGINFFSAGDTILPEKMMINELNFSPITVGLVNGIMALGTVTAGILLSYRKKIVNHVSVMRWCFIINGFITIILPLPIYLSMDFVQNMIFLSAMLFFNYFFIAIANVPFIRIIHEETEDHMKGRVFSNLGVLSSSVVPLAVVLYGIIYDAGYYMTVNIIGGITVIIISFIFLNPSRVHKRAEG